MAQARPRKHEHERALLRRDADERAHVARDGYLER